MARRFYGLLCLGLIVVLLSSHASAGTPPTETVALAGLDAPAEILLDRWGVPHIYAKSQKDAWFVQGWNAARDRLWEIDLWRRSGLGELAAAFGPAYVEQDRAIRLFTWRGDPSKEWQAYGPEGRQTIEAFVAGLDAYIAAALKDPKLLPVEFKLAGYQPALWQPIDVLRVRNHGLSGNVVSEVARAQVLCQSNWGVDALRMKIEPAWQPQIPDGLDPCSIPAGVLDQYLLATRKIEFSPDKLHAGLDRPSNLADAEFDLGTLGSNNWVVAPGKSTTGRPILANDPHRQQAVPSLRYIAHVSAPGLDVIGAGEPALPGVTIGHNDKIAFGFTIFGTDQEDLYVYETNPTEHDDYRYQGDWEAMHVVTEHIAVKGGPDQTVTLHFTRHGPVIYEDRPHHRAYALRATWLGIGGAPYMGELAFQQAGTLDDFRSALTHWSDPPENQLFADTTGRIAWFAASAAPVRHNWDGLLPVPGDGRYEWDGLLDHALLPSEIDPARGWIATANQMNLPQGFPYQERHIAFEWSDPVRFDRISAVLGGLDKISPEDSAQLQNDFVTLAGRRLIGVLATVPTEDPRLRSAIDWLKAWDDDLLATSGQGALFELWFAHHLRPAVIAAVAPEPLRAIIAPGRSDQIIDLMQHPDARLGTTPEAARDRIMLESLGAALDEIEQRLGPDRSTWEWGKLAVALFEHPLSPIAGEAERHELDVGPAPKSGSAQTVSAATYRPKDFHLAAGASVRLVMDVGDWDKSIAINTPGQSGDPTSPHYRDLFPLWLDGKYFPLVYSRAAVEAATERRIALVPR